MIPMRSIPETELHLFPHCGYWVMIEAAQVFERVSPEFLLRR